MQQRVLGTTGLKATVVGFGALEIGRDWGVGNDAMRKRPEEQEAGAVLRGVLDTGVNLVDSASAYHRSEERIGMFLAGERSRYILATKCGEHNDEPNTYYDFSYDAIRGSIERSLALLKTDVIDILQIHFGPDPDRVLDDGGCVRAMREAQQAGKVRFLGASIDGPVLDRCIDSGDFQIVQVAYSLLNRSQEGRIARAAEQGLGVLIRSGLGGGWLTRRALAVPEHERPPKVNALLRACGGDADRMTALGIQFVLLHSGVGSILVGTKSLENLRRSIVMAETPVDAGLMDEAIRVTQG